VRAEKQSNEMSMFSKWIKNWMREKEESEHIYGNTTFSVYRKKSNATLVVVSQYELTDQQKLLAITLSSTLHKIKDCCRIQRMVDRPFDEIPLRKAMMNIIKSLSSLAEEIESI
jgi:hypothetical protein